ncbi:hypothetical protein BCBD1442_19050 [Brucella ceti]|nr:hypothetical protein BCBD1442_19050 [Brucella ceti]
MARPCGKLFRIGNQKEGRQGEFATLQPRGKGNIRPDTRRVANTDGERRKWLCAHVNTDPEAAEAKGREWRPIFGAVND